MKFEKFLKGVGTHGSVIERNNGEKWLVCETVGMKIPKGVTNLLGHSYGEKDRVIFNTIIHSDTTDDLLQLTEAVLFDPEGKSGDIVRVFETTLGDRVGIYNADYGLLEKKDVLTYLEIEVDDPDHEGKVKTVKYIVVLDHANEIQGFITGTQKI